MTPFPLLDDLPDVELQALCLDGEVYRLHGAHVPIGVASGPATRAAAALGDRSPRLIAALGTAAWIWGAAPHPPARGEYLVDLAARWRPPFGGGLIVIESQLREGDVRRFGHAAVTGLVRTAIDLARFRNEFDEHDAETVRRLARLGSFDAESAVRAMDRGRNLSGKRVAARRLRDALSPS
ncbi:MAG: hypothetical protein ACTHMQ_09630 [Protaetiibacter sp.]